MMKSPPPRIVRRWHPPAFWQWSEETGGSTASTEAAPPFDWAKMSAAIEELMRDRPSIKDEFVDRITQALLVHDSVVVSVGGRDVYRIVKHNLADGRSHLKFETWNRP